MFKWAIVTVVGGALAFLINQNWTQTKYDAELAEKYNNKFHEAFKGTDPELMMIQAERYAQILSFSHHDEKMRVKFEEYRGAITKDLGIEQMSRN